MYLLLDILHLVAGLQSICNQVQYQLLEPYFLHQLLLVLKIPNFLKSDAKRIFRDADTIGLPEWFKTTAEWWTVGKITDEEFMRNVDYLQNSGVIRPH